MENVFKNLGYQVYLHRDEYPKTVTVLSIKNTDGTLRWVWNIIISKSVTQDLYSYFNNHPFAYNDAKKFLSNRIINNFGIKKVSEENIANYILLLYKLNKSDIPKKHNSIINIKFNKTSGNNLDKVLFGSLYNDEKVIIKALKKERSNKGLSYFQNLIHYFMDLFSGKEYIITLSGVDDAGKSTVISDLSIIIEKKMRRTSVILCHHPSFYPFSGYGRIP